MTSPLAPHEFDLTEHVPAATILAASTQMLGEAREASQVARASYVPEAAITGAASPASRKLEIVNRGQDGAGTTVLATLAFTAGVNAVAGDEKDMTVTAVPGANVVAAGDILAVVSSPVGGTGLADPGGLVQVVLARR
jgi:hypothetical protein